MCTAGHPELKADLDRLRTETTPIGAQLGFDGTVDCYLRNCNHCHSTLGIEVAVAMLLDTSESETPHAGLVCTPETRP